MDHRYESVETFDLTTNEAKPGPLLNQGRQYHVATVVSGLNNPRYYPDMTGRWQMNNVIFVVGGWNNTAVIKSVSCRKVLHTL